MKKINERLALIVIVLMIVVTLMNIDHSELKEIFLEVHIGTNMCWKYLLCSIYKYLYSGKYKYLCSGKYNRSIHGL